MVVGIGLFAAGNSSAGSVAFVLTWFACIFLMVCPVLNVTLYGYWLVHQNVRLKDAQDGLKKATISALIFAVVGAAALRMLIE